MENDTGKNTEDMTSASSMVATAMAVAQDFSMLIINSLFQLFVQPKCHIITA